MTTERIIDKIRKLLALANNDGAAEGERDNALRMAYNLIAKHNLEMSDINPQEEKRSDTKELFYGRPWARDVCNAVAGLFFCKYYLQRSRTSNMVHHHFVGKLSNSVTAMELSMFLISSIRREAGKRARALGMGAEWRRSFSTGAADRIKARVYEMREQKEVETSSGNPGTSLVLADYYKVERELNEAFLKEQGVKLRMSRSSRKYSLGSAHKEGGEYGSTLPLGVSVAGPVAGLLK